MGLVQRQLINIHGVGDIVAQKGWYVARNIDPPALSHILRPVHASMNDDYLKDLATSFQKVRAEKFIIEKREFVL